MGMKWSAEGMFGGYASSEGSSSGTERSDSASSPTSTTHTSISEQSLESLRYPRPIDVIASPPTVVTVGGTQYSTSELRVMADVVAQARKTGELPPTTSSPHDSKAIIHDHTHLSQLRLARGDPALPPPKEYTSLRVETARRIRERDATLGDEECQRAASDRVEGYLRVVGQERRFYDLAKEIARRRGVESRGGDMERITQEVLAVVEKGIGTTAESLDLTASELDSTVCIFDTLTRSLSGSTNTLNMATAKLDTTSATLNSTAGTLENTLGVMATQIGTLNSQLLALTDILQSQRAPTSPTPPIQPGIQPHAQQMALEDSVRKSIEHAIREAMYHAQMPTLHSETSSVRSCSYQGRTSWDDHSCSESSDSTIPKPKAMKRAARTRQGAKVKTRRRAGRYVRIVIDRILG